MGLWNIASNQVYAQADDPGAVGAGSFWTDTDANLTYRRNDANTDWDVVGTSSAVSSTEYGYLDGVTSAIQTQLDAKTTPQTLTTVAALTKSAYGDLIVVGTEIYRLKNGFIALTGSDTTNIIDKFESYANTTEGDAVYATGNTALMRVNPTTNVIDFDVQTVQTELYRNLAAAVSNTAWVMRFKFVLTTETATSGTTLSLFVVLSSSNASFSTSQDGIGLRFASNATGGTIDLVDADAGSLNAASATFTHALAVETLYVEIIRVDATNYTVNLYSDSAYSTLVETKSSTCASTTDTLDTFKVCSDGFTDGRLTGTITNLEIYSGITSGYPT